MKNRATNDCPWTMRRRTGIWKSRDGPSLPSSHGGTKPLANESERCEHTTPIAASPLRPFSTVCQRPCIANDQVQECSHLCPSRIRSSITAAKKGALPAPRPSRLRWGENHGDRSHPGGSRDFYPWAQSRPASMLSGKWSYEDLSMGRLSRKGISRRSTKGKKKTNRK